MAGDRREHRRLCSTNPGFEIDLYVRASLRSMTAVWMGLSTVKTEIDAGQIELIGDPEVASSMQKWLVQPLRQGENRAAH